MDLLPFLSLKRDETRDAYGLRTSDDDEISRRAPVDVLLVDAALDDIIEDSAQPILCPAPGTIASAPPQPPYIEKDRTLRR